MANPDSLGCSAGTTRDDLVRKWDAELWYHDLEAHRKGLSERRAKSILRRRCLCCPGRCSLAALRPGKSRPPNDECRPVAVVLPRPAVAGLYPCLYASDWAVGHAPVGFRTGVTPTRGPGCCHPGSRSRSSLAWIRFLRRCLTRIRSKATAFETSRPMRSGAVGFPDKGESMRPSRACS